MDPSREAVVQIDEPQLTRCISHKLQLAAARPVQLPSEIFNGFKQVSRTLGNVSGPAFTFGRDLPLLHECRTEKLSMVCSNSYGHVETSDLTLQEETLAAPRCQKFIPSRLEMRPVVNAPRIHDRAF